MWGSPFETDGTDELTSASARAIDWLSCFKTGSSWTTAIVRLTAIVICQSRTTRLSSVFVVFSHLLALEMKSSIVFVLAAALPALLSAAPSSPLFVQTDHGFDL